MTDATLHITNIICDISDNLYTYVNDLFTYHLYRVSHNWEKPNMTINMRKIFWMETHILSFLHLIWHFDKIVFSSYLIQMFSNKF